MADVDSPVVVGMPANEAEEPAELVLEEQAAPPVRPPPTKEELEMMAEMESINASAERLVADHLDAYIRRNGGDATFEGWIGVLHPENVTLDGRLLLPDSAHLRLWKEREGSLGTASTFWQDFARLTGGMARGVAASLTPRSAAAPGSGGVEAPTPPANTAAAAAAAPSAAGTVAPAALGGPLDGSDVLSLEEARAEVARLRSLLSQPRPAATVSTASAAASSSASGASAGAGAGGGRLDVLLRMTGFGGASPTSTTEEAVAGPTLAEQRAALAMRTAPLAPTVSADDAFGELFARQERRGTVAAAAAVATPTAGGGGAAHAAAASVSDLFGTPPGASSSRPPPPPPASAAVPVNPFGDAGDSRAPPPAPPASAAFNPFGDASVDTARSAAPSNPFGDEDAPATTAAGAGAGATSGVAGPANPFD